MTNKEAIAHLKERNENLVKVAKDENVYDYEKQAIEADCMRSYFEVNEKAIQALEQQHCEDVLDKIKAEIIEKFDNCSICEWFEDYDYDENDISEYMSVGSILDIIYIIDKYRK